MSKAMQLKARIKNIAMANHIPAQAVLQNFMLERLLERISVSKYKDMFVLKGGMLIASMVGIGSRTTMDMDVTLLGYPLFEEKIRELKFGQKIGHQVRTKSLEGDKLGFPRPHLSTTRLHGQVYQQSRIYGGIVRR